MQGWTTARRFYHPLLGCTGSASAMNFYSDIFDVVAVRLWMLCAALEFQSGLPALQNSCFFVGRQST
jgi:hypothetical protein